MGEGRIELHVDFETYCEVDIRKCGADVYTRHPSCEAILMSWAFGDDGPVKLWEPDEGQPFPEEVSQALSSDDVLIWAHNASFERSVFNNVLGMDVPIRRFRDSAVLARWCSFPAALSQVCNIVGLDSDMAKLSEGRALIKLFCTPNGGKAVHDRNAGQKELGLGLGNSKRIRPRSRPQQWQRFREYNIRDVVAEREVVKRLRKYDMPWLWEEYEISERINERGLPINLDMVRNAITVYEQESERLKEEMRKATGLRNPNSALALLDWLRARGYPLGTVQKGDVEAGILYAERKIAEAQDPRVVSRWREVLHVLRLRQESAKSSVKKFYALERATDRETGRLRGSLEYYGAARTGRYAGRIFQPQNLPRPPYWLGSIQAQHDVAEDLEVFDRDTIEVLYGNVLEVLKAGLRPAVQAPPGKVFCDADLASIEARGTAWVTGCQPMLDVFAQGKDIYMAFAAEMYGVTYEQVEAEKKAGDKSKRTAGKPGVLGCCYGLGEGKIEENEYGIKKANGLLGYAWSMGIDLTPEQSSLSVKTYREKYVEVPRFWRDIIHAIGKTVKDYKPRRVGKVVVIRNKNFLEIILPSKRRLRYYKPAMQLKETPWGEVRPTFTYMGIDQKTKAWTRLKTHGGKVLENIVQAIARDILVAGLKNAEAAGLEVFLHVHDQIVALSDEDEAEQTLEKLIKCMTTPPDWAEGFPLEADGVITKVFVKD